MLARSKVAILSAAKGQYLRYLLEKLCPDIVFDAILGLEDAVAIGELYKPNPQLLKNLMTKFKVPPKETLVIGDSSTDIQMAYRAGAYSLLVKFNSSKSSRNFLAARRLVPHAVYEENTYEYCGPEYRIKDVLFDFPCYDTYIEALQNEIKAEDLKRDSTDMTSKLRHDFEDREVEIGVSFLGRYFSGENDGLNHRVELREDHLLTKQILRKEEGDASVPGKWVAAAEKFFRVREGRAGSRKKILVTVIPSKTGRPRRNEQLLEILSEKLNDIAHLSFDSEIFYFLDGAESNKGKGSKERFENIVRYLRIRDAAVREFDGFYIVDDVCTAGATLLGAKRLLLGQDKSDVKGLVIARTIGFPTEQENENDAQ